MDPPSFDLPGYEPVLPWHTYASPADASGRRDMLVARRVTHLSVSMLSEILVNRARVCLAAGRDACAAEAPVSLLDAVSRLDDASLYAIAAKIPGAMERVRAVMPRASPEQETRSVRCLRLVGHSISAPDYSILLDEPAERTEASVAAHHESSILGPSTVGNGWYADYVLTSPGMPDLAKPLAFNHVAAGRVLPPTAAVLAAVDRATNALGAACSPSFVQQVPDVTDAQFRTVLRATVERWRAAGKASAN